MKFNIKKIVGVVLTGTTLVFSLVAGTGCSGGDVGKWFEDQYKQLTCEHKTEAVVAAVPATCTEAGLTAGIKCGDCGKMIVKQDKVPALGHTLTHFDEVEPSCLVSGLTAGDYCGVCETWVVKQDRIKATGHKVVTLEAVAATCTKTGLTEGQVCDNCGEVYKAQEVVAVKEHTFNDNHVCITCSACDHSVVDYVCEYCGMSALEPTTVEDKLEVGATYYVKQQDDFFTINIYEVLGHWLGDYSLDVEEFTIDAPDFSHETQAYIVDFDKDGCNAIELKNSEVRIGDSLYHKVVINSNTAAVCGEVGDERELLFFVEYNFGTEAFKVAFE